MPIDDRLKKAAIARAGAIQPGEAFAGMKVLSVETLDGIKFFLENPASADKKNAAETWLLLRASGSKPLSRVYCESCSVKSLNRVLEVAREPVLAAVGAWGLLATPPALLKSLSKGFFRTFGDTGCLTRLEEE